tara:strand:- start:22 stop:492 length:471 start_codon:yes stop_codon:yes gene_type:complete
VALTKVRAGGVADDAITTGKLPTGSILQVVQTTGSTEVAASGTSWTTTDAAVTITPTSASSKILVMHSAGGLAGTVGNVGIRIRRGSTVVYESIRFGYQDDSNFAPVNWAVSYLDSPSTTSATTYDSQIKAGVSVSGGLRHSDAATWTMIAMEIAG